MKKQYEKPTMTVAEIHQQNIICTSDPDVNDEVGGGEQFSRRRDDSDWDDDRGVWDDDRGVWDEE